MNCPEVHACPQSRQHCPHADETLRYPQVDGQRPHVAPFHDLLVEFHSAPEIGFVAEVKWTLTANRLPQPFRPLAIKVHPALLGSLPGSQISSTRHGRVECRH